MSSSKEMSVKPERTDSSITATLYQPPRLPHSPLSVQPRWQRPLNSGATPIMTNL
jgi:hypothetical protein